MICCRQENGAAWGGKDDAGRKEEGRMSDFMKKFSLDSRIALITGASYGIGFAIATAYAEAGATIVFRSEGAHV